MKSTSLFVFGALLGSIVLAPFAALAADGLVALVFVSPANAAIGETVEVNVETSLWGSAVAVDNLTGSIGLFSGTDLNFTMVSSGKYHASYMIDAGAVSYGSMSISVSADMGLLSDSDFVFYSVRNAGTSGGSWTVRARIVNMGQVGTAPSPGQNATLEARSYLNGALADGGAVNGTLTSQVGVTTHSDPVSGTKLSAGVYRFSVSVPSDLSTTTFYGFEAKLGTGILDPSDTITLVANPFPVLVSVVAQTNTSATVKVWAGGATPLAGATVTLQGDGYQFTYPYIITVGPFTATTDAHGAATITANWNATSGYITFTLTVTSGGKTVKSFVAIGGGGITWTPAPNSNYGCAVVLQTDPSTIQAGQSATLKFRVTENGTNVASHSVARWVWRQGAGGSEQAGNVTTDASGNFTVTYAFAANFSSHDTLNVKVLCPSGDSDSKQVTTMSGGGLGTGHMTVTASGAAPGGSVAITATYTGTNALNGAQAFATIVPGNSTTVRGESSGAGTVVAELAKSGTTFTGSLSVPSWYPEGDYVVLALITNRGAAPTTAEEITEGNASVIHIAAGSGGGGGGGGGKGFVPGFDGLAALAAVGAGAAVLALGRRRRLVD